ncbi:MAG: hypothetical protein KKD18_03630 [Nanoarchaeota archaeon]|nr:hypothetical protein [Nanoarchaeota archaeon]MBU0977481.1 hypothetical protein [Nanoarchaeota archaeon]
MTLLQHLDIAQDVVGMVCEYHACGRQDEKLYVPRALIERRNAIRDMAYDCEREKRISELRLEIGREYGSFAVTHNLDIVHTQKIIQTKRGTKIVSGCDDMEDGDF